MMLGLWGFLTRLMDMARDGIGCACLENKDGDKISFLRPGELDEGTQREHERMKMRLCGRVAGKEGCVSCVLATYV